MLDTNSREGIYSYNLLSLIIGSMPSDACIFVRFVSEYGIKEGYTVRNPRLQTLNRVWSGIAYKRFHVCRGIRSYPKPTLQLHDITFHVSHTKKIVGR